MIEKTSKTTPPAHVDYPPAMLYAFRSLLNLKECRAAFVRAYGTERASHELPESPTGAASLANARSARETLANLLTFARAHDLNWLAACRAARAVIDGGEYR